LADRNQALTGHQYDFTQYGKPTTLTYKFAEKTLRDQLEYLHGHRNLPPVYMIGDNPESDIAGANGADWSSILVHTGVYNHQAGPPAHRPTHESENVESAVLLAIQEAWKRRD
jgi:ribonucleotide monophosphatase NagD (HAD superfamily)